MKLLHVFLVALLSAAIAFGTATWVSRNASTVNGTHESTYDRVMRTGTLRCGYLQYPLFVERDLNTGNLSGIYVDIIEELGNRLNLKIDWAQEVGFGDAFDGLKTDRYDAMCFPFNQTPGRARVTEFSMPILFSPSFIYARADDVRFDDNYAKINSPDVKMAFIEGELTQTIRNEDFSKTQPVSLTGLADVAEVFMQIATGKADVAITEPSTADKFMKNNPGKIKRVLGPPIRMQQVGVDVGVGEDSLLRLINTTFQSMLASGFIQRTVNKYIPAPDQLYFPAQPWGESAKPATEGKQP